VLLNKKRILSCHEDYVLKFMPCFTDVIVSILMCYSPKNIQIQYVQGVNAIFGLADKQPILLKRAGD